MSDLDVRIDESPARSAQRLTRAIQVLLGFFFFSAAAIWYLNHLNADGSFGSGVTEELTAANSVSVFQATVVNHSKPIVGSRRPPPENSSIWPLRTQMFIDSLVLEPAYGGLLVLLMLELRRSTRSRKQEWDWPFQFACLLVALAIAFDVAENGMTVRAAEDALRGLLARGTVEDVHLATRLKWGFIGAATLMLGFFGWRALSFASHTSKQFLVPGVFGALATTALVVPQCFPFFFGSDVRANLLPSLATAFGAALIAISWAVIRQARGEVLADRRDGRPGFG